MTRFVEQTRAKQLIDCYQVTRRSRRYDDTWWLLELARSLGHIELLETDPDVVPSEEPMDKDLSGFMTARWTYRSIQRTRYRSNSWYLGPAVTWSNVIQHIHNLFTIGCCLCASLTIAAVQVHVLVAGAAASFASCNYAIPRVQNVQMANLRWIQYTDMLASRLLMSPKHRQLLCTNLQNSLWNS